MDNKLKPCPFCGGEAEMFDHFRIAKCKTYRYFRVGCKECDLRFPKFAATKENAIKAWNRRVEDGNE